MMSQDGGKNRSRIKNRNRKGDVAQVTIIIYGIIALAIMLGVIALALTIS